MIDAVTIRRTFEAFLWSGSELEERDHDHFVALLHGHVWLLLPEVEGLAQRMRGEHQRTALYVAAQTRRTLRSLQTAPPQARSMLLWDLANRCRALLTLYQRPGPLDARPAGPDGGDRR